MDDNKFLRDFEQNKWPKFREIERYAQLTKRTGGEFGQVTDDTEATF